MKFSIPGVVSGTTQGFCAAALHGNDMAILSSEQSKILIISHQTKKELGRLSHGTSENSKGYGMCMCLKSISIDSKPHVLVGYENGHIVLWDTETYSEVSDAAVHSEAMMCMDYSERLKKGASGSTDDKISIWTINADQINVMKHIQITNPGLNCLKFRCDDKILVSGGWDGQVRVFSGKTLRPLAVLSSHKESIMCVTFLNDNSFLVGSKDGTISSWSVYKNQ